MKQRLSPELTHLVDWSVSELGKVIETEIGTAGFRRIENIRRFVKTPAKRKIEGLLKLKAQLESLSSEEQYQVAHAFALMLELINSCESAYRTHRLQQEQRSEHVAVREYQRVIHVLTAHPTESRSPDIIFYFKKIQKILVQRLEAPRPEDEKELRNLLLWAWQIPMSKQRRPSVMDEAAYIYSLALDKEVIEVYLKQRSSKQPFYIRTWVGGDKDGHPGVDEKTMLGSLQMSRGLLLKWLSDEFAEFLEDLKPLLHSPAQKKRIASLEKSIKNLKKHFPNVRVIRAGDSHRVYKLREKFDQLTKSYVEIFAVESATLTRVRHFFRVFPGLVVPLEIREESSQVHEAVEHPQKNLNIKRMLKALAKISPGHDPLFYVRGFVLSQTESAKDIEAGLKLSKLYLQEPRLPILPLFESSHALKNSKEIIEEYLKSSQRRKIVKQYWSGQLEVMVGYSDSAKENGSFPSKFLIQEAMLQLERVIRKHDLRPIFFHGSGGSVERGGGSIQEQTDWWPSSALESVKVTIQGEMIYRSYTSPKILSRQLERFAEARDAKRKLKIQTSAVTLKSLQNLATAVQKKYQDTLKDPNFLNMIEVATPYSYLKDLKMGSRPSKRQGGVNLKSLRAIPWVLCWTQTRTLFPSWWGVGSYWRTLSRTEKNNLKRAFRESTLFSSYVKLLGFTLQKIEMNTFQLYLESSHLSMAEKKLYRDEFLKELKACKVFFKELTGQNDYLWYRRWLKTSIQLRSPLIDPLNILQLIALKQKNFLLLRETVTGVASGMLTTG